MKNIIGGAFLLIIVLLFCLIDYFKIRTKAQAFCFFIISIALIVLITLTIRYFVHKHNENKNSINNNYIDRLHHHENQDYKNFSTYHTLKFDNDSFSDEHIYIEEIYVKFSDSPYNFEEYCAKLFRAMGYKAKTTPKSNDLGYDIFLETTLGETGIVECKCFKQGSCVGRPTIQKLVGANATIHAEEMYFITTCHFSKQAIEYANKTGVTLIDGNSLERLINHYQNAFKYI